MFMFVVGATGKYFDILKYLIIEPEFQFFIVYFLYLCIEGMELWALASRPQFRFDHPFVYFILETTTNIIIFSGRITRFV